MNRKSGNDLGFATLSRHDLFRSEDPSKDDKSPVYGFDESRRLAGFVVVSPTDDSRLIELKLQPACRVTGEVDNPALPRIGREFRELRIWVLLDSLPYTSKMPISFASEDSRFELLLAPGKYRLIIFGTDSYAAEPEVEIREGQRVLTLPRTELKPLRTLALLGKAAPELRRIKAWKNGTPVSLAGLRGKVVLLDFWGYWCGPCIREMPYLMRMHDAYSDQGLVIIAIHDDTVSTVAEMDEKMRKVRETSWAGR